MKKSSKAALLSALVFPGVGLYLLKLYVRGSIFFIPALLAILYIIHGLGPVTNELSGKLQVNPYELLDSARLSKDIMASIDSHMPFYHQAVSLFIVSWIISIVSSYFAGRKQEIDDSQTTIS